MSADVFLQATPMKRRKLNDEHRKVLVDGSGILPGIVKARGYYTLNKAGIKILVGEGVLHDGVLAAESWLGIPIYRPDGSYYGDIIRLFGAPDHVSKYTWPSGQSQVVDVHPTVLEQLGDASVPLFVAEGIKKSDAVLSQAMREGIRLIPIGVNGCWGWMSKTTAGSIACPDFRDIPMNKRLSYVCSDSDFRTNDDVRRGWSEACVYFASKMQDRSKALLIVVPGYGVEKQGADDFITSGGTITELLAYASTPKLALLEQNEHDELPRQLSFRTGMEVVSAAPEKVPYLMEPLISQGSINLMAGHSGTYKTWHMLSLMLDLAFGYAWTEHPGTKVPCDPVTSIYVNKEMSGGMLDVRLRQLANASRYADHPDFQQILSERIIVVEEAELDLSVSMQRDRLEELVMDTGAQIIFLDSFSMCWTGDENSASEVASFYMQMREITEHTGVTWILVHHLIKPQTGNRREVVSKFSVRGSGQIIQQADAALLFSIIDKETPNEAPVIAISHSKTRTTTEMPTWVSKFTERDGLFVSLTYSGALAERKAEEYVASRGDPKKLAEWVKTALETMPVMRSSASGLRTRPLVALLLASWPNKKDAPSESTLRRALDNMVASGELDCEPNRRLGDLYRLQYEVVISSETEEPGDPKEETT